MKKTSHNRTSYQRARTLITKQGAEAITEGPILEVTRDGVPQSYTDLSRPGRLEFEYLQHMNLAYQAFATLPRWGEHVRAIHIGTGGATLPLSWLSLQPEMTQIAVDIDDELLALVESWADLPKRSRLKLRAGDGRSVLEGSSSTFDLVVRDAFKGRNTPNALSNLSWTELVASRLRPHGLYLANVGHDPHRPGKAEVAAILEVFPQAFVLTDQGAWQSKRSGNIMVAAWKEGQPDWGELERSIRSLPFPAALHRLPRIRQWVAGTRPDFS